MRQAISRVSFASVFLLALGCGSAEGDADPASAGTASGGVPSGGVNAGGASGGVSASSGSAGAAGHGTAGASNGGAPSGGVGGVAHAGASQGGASAGGMSQAGAGSTSGGASGSGGMFGSGGVSGSGGMSGGGSGGGTSVVFPPNCKCLGLGPPSCVPTGNVTFTLAKSASPTADEQSAYDEITCAMTAAVAYYNCNTSITKKLNVTYVPSVQTADGNFNGSIRFGSDRSYMKCATSMHEIGHTLGVGTAPNWSKLSVDGDFNGDAATTQLRAITGKADDVVHSDTQHFWPYGLNYESEAKSTADLVNHCLMVTAIHEDLGL